MPSLDVNLHGKLAGHLERDDAGAIRFRYSDIWSSKRENESFSAISLSFESGHEVSAAAAQAFISGLLPDSGRHRQLLATTLGIESDPTDVSFLAKLGGDCAGAITFVRQGDDRTAGRQPVVDKLTDDELEGLLTMLPHSPLLIDGGPGMASSLAGVNDKAAIVASHNHIGIPKNGALSTHIIKTDIAGLKDSIKVEHFCLRLAAACGQVVPKTEIKVVGNHSFMLMQRYDRKCVATNEGLIVQSVHQEDFCQALGILPSKKYERFGGPSWKDAFNLLDRTTDPISNRRTLLDRAILQFLIGNPDAHGKNYALIHERSGEVRISPFYDLNNAAAFKANFKATRPIMAMAIGNSFRTDTIRLENWKDFAKTCSLEEGLVIQRITTLASEIIDKVAELRDGMLGSTSNTPLLDLVVSDIISRARHWREP